MFIYIILYVCFCFSFIYICVVSSDYTGITVVGSSSSNLENVVINVQDKYIANTNNNKIILIKH